MSLYGEETAFLILTVGNSSQASCLYGWLHRRLLKRYTPQSAVNCSTLWERAAGSTPNTSQVSLKREAKHRIIDHKRRLNVYGVTYNYMTWHHMTWHYMTLHGNTLQHMTWPCMARHYSTWHDSTRHDRTWPCMARHDSTWHDSAFPYEVSIQDTTRHDNSCAHRKGERTEEKKKGRVVHIHAARGH